MTPKEIKDLPSTNTSIVTENIENIENIEAAGENVDRHTVVDEITDNIIKLMIIVFIFGGLVYCIVKFVGVDKGVDPNLVWGYFGGVASSIIPTYFTINKFKKEKINGG